MIKTFNWRNVWFEPESEQIRWWWRVLIFLGVAWVLSALFFAFLELLVGVIPLPAAFFEHPLFNSSVQGLADLFAFLIAGIWALRTLERLPARTLGLQVSWKGIRNLFAGAGVGVGLIVLCMVIVWSTTSARFTFNPISPDQWGANALTMGLMLMLALREVVIYRGYAFQTMLRGSSVPVAILLVTAPFAALHVYNPHVTPLALANIAVASVLFSIIYLRSGSLWLTFGAHIGWNMGLVLFGLKVSGLGKTALDFNSPITTAYIRSPLVHWLTGAGVTPGTGFGPEGGLVASLVLLSAVAVASLPQWGLSLHSRWWEWTEISRANIPPLAVDFSIGDRHYQWKLIVKDEPGV